MRVVLHPRSHHQRCAYCHDDGEPRLRICHWCRTFLHWDCLDELGGCPTLGCPDARRRPREVVVARPRRRFRGDRWWLLVAIAAFVLYGTALVFREQLADNFRDEPTVQPWFRGVTLLTDTPTSAG
jgi:hypothetical protein